jgi:hypothetical protein
VFSKDTAAHHSDRFQDDVVENKRLVPGERSSKLAPSVLFGDSNVSWTCF